jgi:hypothetical protein
MVGPAIPQHVPMEMLIINKVSKQPSIPYRVTSYGHFQGTFSYKTIL